MKRGDVVTVAAPGDFGKPRPAVIIQTDLLNETHPTILVCLITSAVRQPSPFRLLVEPNGNNGLRKPSMIMVDKITTMRREKVGSIIGRLDEQTMRMLDRSLLFVCGLAR